MPNVSVKQFWKYCMQILLIAANFVVLLFGLSVLCVGLWALLSEQHYYVITDGDPEFTRIPISLIIVGTFVSILALLGVVGGFPPFFPPFPPLSSLPSSSRSPTMKCTGW